MNDDFELPVKPAAKGAKRGPAPAAPIDAPVSVAEPKPAEDKEDVQTPKWTSEELLAVFDHLIFSGEYSETMTRGRFSATFRTRTAEETHGIQMDVDGANLKLIASVDSFRMMKIMCLALVAFRGKQLPTSEEEKEKFIARLPGPVMAMLMDMLYEFDSKVSASLSEGQKNF